MLNEIGIRNWTDSHDSLTQVNEKRSKEVNLVADSSQLVEKNHGFHLVGPSSDPMGGMIVKYGYRPHTHTQMDTSFFNEVSTSKLVVVGN